MTFALKTAATALALILTPLAVAAHHKSGHGGGNGNGHAAQEDRGNGNGNAHGHANRGSDDGEDVAGDDAGDDEEDEDAEGDEDVATGGNHPCAPGLSGREPACVPPGQAAKDVTTADWIGEPTDPGETISDDDYGWIVNADRLGLDPVEEGQRYALVDDTIVLVDEETLDVIEVIRRAAIPGNSGG